MATFYVGVRPVLRGRNDSDFFFRQKETTLSGNARSGVGTYSHYPNFGPGLLTGGPDNDYTPGTGRHPHGLTLTRRYRGLDTLNPMDSAGSGERIDGARYRPLEYKGLPGATALGSGLGHLPRASDYAVYNNFEYDGLGTDALAAPGHIRRSIGAAGTANTFGAFDPLIYKGTTTAPLSATSKTVPTGYDNEYGSNRVNEWQGVTSAKAL